MNWRKVDTVLAACLLSLIGLLARVQAEYAPRIVVEHPFPTGVDSLDYPSPDSSASNWELRVTIRRESSNETLIVSGVTDDSGSSTFHFATWSASGTPVYASEIERMDISFPNTWRVVNASGQVGFEPLRVESIPFTGAANEVVRVVLPICVHSVEYTIGTGPFEFSILVLADMHVAEGKKMVRHGLLNMADFGSDGFVDEDNDPIEETFATYNCQCILDFVEGEYLQDNHVKFLVLPGDITSSAESSEFVRARSIFSDYSTQIPFYVPLFGNHDGWPYVGAPWTGYLQKPAAEVVIGKYFHEALRRFVWVKRYLPVL